MRSMEPAKPEEPSQLVIPGAVAPFPVLVHHINDNTQALFSISDNTSRAVTIPEITGRYFPTSYGWILVLGPPPDWETFLWNPHSGERIQLPEMGVIGDEILDNKRCSCLLSDDVASPTCGVLIYDRASPNMWYCRVNGGSHVWLSYDYDIGSMDVPDETCQAVLVEKKKTFHTIASFKGRFYFDESADTTGTLEFSGDGGDETESQFGDMDVGWVEFPDGSAAADMFMLESGGELFHVCIFYTLPCLDAPSGFGVYKMDFSEPPAWRKTDDIGDRVFLLQGEFSASSSCSASECGLRRNLVYWVNSRVDVTCLYVFDLNDGGITMVQPCQGTPDPLPRPPFWMLPAASSCQ
uniref:Uncharacterized protein n=1 Tax=Avena sativa TaxID=4498 RepID=A0ACD5U4P7_AVESA